MAARNVCLCVVICTALAHLPTDSVAQGQKSAAAVSADLLARVDELFAPWNRLDSPGCAVGIIWRGEPIYCKGFGSANLEYQAANTPLTLFDVMSFSKSLTCACVAILMDEGKIAPEDDVRKYVPELHAFDPPVRIGDMVRCTSGLWDTVLLPVLVGYENAPRQFPLREADYLTLLAGQ